MREHETSHADEESKETGDCEEKSGLEDGVRNDLVRRRRCFALLHREVESGTEVALI